MFCNMVYFFYFEFNISIFALNKFRIRNIIIKQPSFFLNMTNRSMQINWLRINYIVIIIGVMIFFHAQKDIIQNYLHVNIF